MPLLQGIKNSLVLLVLLIFAADGVASPVHLSGNWSQPYGDDTDQWKLGQSYNLDLSNDLTSALRISANMRYATNKKKDSADMETLSPSVLVSLNNDLFNLSLNGMENRRKVEDEPTNINRSWSSTFVSSLDERYWPQLRLNYSQSMTTNDASPKTTDQESQTFNSSIKYSLYFLSFLYDFSKSIDNDLLDDTENENTNHSGRVQWQDSYWNNRLSVVASHKYTRDTNVITAPTEGGQIDRDLLPSAGLASLDDTPLDDALTSEPSLIDGDDLTPTAIEVLQPGETVNVGVQINLESFNKLTFYLDREIDTNVQSRLSWSFYGSLDNQDWNLITVPATIVYSSEDARTVVTIEFSSSVENLRYVKAAILSTAGLDTAYFTEITVSQLVTLPPGQNSLTTLTRTHLSQGSISFRPWDKWNLGYTLNRNNTTADNRSESLQFNQTLNSSLNLNRWFALSMSVNESRDEIEQQEKIKNRSYAMSYRTTPLDSLSFSVGGTRTERLTDSERVSRSDTLSSHLSATLYPDLTAGLSANWTRSADMENDSESSDWDYRIDIAARFTDSFNLSTSYTYRNNDDGSVENNYEINTVYRPSTYISLTTGYRHTETIDNLYSTLNFRLTRKIQTDFRYVYLKSDTKGQTANFNLTWNLSSIFNIRQSLAWADEDSGQTWSGVTTVNYNF